MTKLFRPKIDTKTPAAAPDVPTIEAPKQELGGDKTPVQRRKAGRNALRIDPQIRGNTRDGNGINVPLK